MSVLSIIASNIPAATATFVAAVTALFAALKYYSDKAAKVTEFRKAWVESLRLAVAEFGGSIHLIVGRISIKSKATPAPVPAKTPSKSLEEELASELLPYWSKLRVSYNTIILHLNPAEHESYLIAERAVSESWQSKFQQETKDAQVFRFLCWCLSLADARIGEVPRHRKLRWNRRQKFKKIPSAEQVTVAALTTAQEKLRESCTDFGSILLLAAFATRQLAHGDYKTVLKHYPEIERGIRIVDTAAANVVKGVWEDVKRGEPSSRWAGLSALVISVLLIVSIVIALVLAPKQNSSSSGTNFNFYLNDKQVGTVGGRTDAAHPSITVKVMDRASGLTV